MFSKRSCSSCGLYMIVTRKSSVCIDPSQQRAVLYWDDPATFEPACTEARCLNILVASFPNTSVYSGGH